MKFILALLLIPVILVTGCYQAGECGKLSLTIVTNVTVNNSVDAFNTIKQFEFAYPHNTYSDTQNATIDELKFVERELTDGTVSEVWVLNNDVAIDKNGNMYVVFGCI